MAPYLLVSVLSSILYINVIVMASSVGAGNGNVAEYAGLVLSFVPLSNWIESLGFSLAPYARAQFQNVPTGSITSFELMSPFIIA